MSECVCVCVCVSVYIYIYIYVCMLLHACQSLSKVHPCSLSRTQLCFMLLDLEGRPRDLGHIGMLIEKNAPQVVAAACPAGSMVASALSSDPIGPPD